MTHWLSLARAAQLVGAHRSTLQRLVREGALASVDGQVSTEELLRVFPGAVPERGGDLERVTRIKEESFGRRVRERLLPSQEVLAQRLFAQGCELADTRRHLERYHALVTAVQERLADLAGAHAPAAELLAWTEAELARTLALDATDPLEALDAALGVMSPRVTVRPSGREFLAEGHDTILQAGLKSGLGLAYGCGNGTCGLCRARVLDGEVRRVRHHDYPLSEAERAQGHVLMCCCTPVTDVQLETLEAAGPADIPLQHITASVRAVTPLAEGTLLLHLQTPRSSRLRFLAGQSVSLGAATAAGDVETTSPIASCPCDDRNIQFHVGRDESDPFATALFAGRIRPNDPVTIAGPAGRFVLDAGAGRDLVFAACDLGFAPVKSLVEYALSAEAANSCTLLWLATRADGHYLANQCRSWADSLDGFRFEALADTDVARGTRRLVDAWADRSRAARSDAFVAGPAAFAEACADALREAGVPPERIALDVLAACP